MDYRQRILADYSKPTILEIAEDIGDDPRKFKDLMDLFTEGQWLLTQRSAWAVRAVGKKHPRLFLPHLERMIQMLTEEHHDAVARNNLALMAEWDIPEEHWDDLYAICFEILENPQKAIAIRVHAMQILSNIASKIPDLIPELLLVIEAHLPNGSKGFQSRGKKLVKRLNKIHLNGMR
ncbi:MAG: hypothetical protein MRZ79_03570 [Bacteroidia bacterium]|nr:hypothetical protein [Bacteroidia bacterium]